MIRKAHGKGAKSAIVRVETAPLDELPRGRPAPPAPEPLRDPRKGFGPLPKGSPEARALAARASRAAAEKARRLRALQGLGFPDGTPRWLAPYEAAATGFAEAITADLAQHVGGGTCPTYAAILVQSASLALASSRVAYSDAVCDPALASKLADSARMQVLTAYELTARAAGRAAPALNPVLERYFPGASAPAKRGTK